MATPDRLGIAHSFQQALEAGASVEEVARNAGQHVAYVTNHLALMQVPQELAELVADGQLPLSVAVAVAGIKEEAKHIGLALFVLSCAPTYPTAAVVQQVARTLKRWAGLQLPLETSSQAERTLPCGWDHWALLHRQTSLETMQPREPFYLLDEGASATPPLFFPMLAKSLAMPLLPAWEAHLWVQGRLRGLILSLRDDSYGLGGWRVEAEEELWRAVVCEGLQSGVLSFEVE